ncbi:hypothetical protein Scep_017540 [Stephania cephalantha]|uniref:Protein kinase domain-containing protein n=1 Tax=Stephania cephalantha TaxID=152367 RepID=A0AAP0IRK5_9MAGN
MIKFGIQLVKRDMQGLAYIHDGSIGMCHRDIKPQNLLVLLLILKFVIQK